MAPPGWVWCWEGVAADGGRRSHRRVPRGRQRTGAPALRRSLLWFGGCHCAPGPARGSFVADRAAVAQLGMGSAFPPGSRVK